jgi:hypothetical protein
LIFFENKGLQVSQKSLGATEFFEKLGKKIVIDFLLSFHSKLSHFDKNLNLNYKWLSPTWRKPSGF